VIHAHIVLAHPEPLSFNGHLATIARDSLEQQGWSVSTTDLYGKNEEFEFGVRACIVR
jgi:NAD(P)H dehydrogenase (quinone)